MDRFLESLIPKKEELLEVLNRFSAKFDPGTGKTIITRVLASRAGVGSISIPSLKKMAGRGRMDKN